MGLKRICASIRKYNNFLITAHTNLEGDALGSELSFYSLIRKLGKQGVILNEDGIPYGHDFLPGIKKIRKLDDKSSSIKFDCLVVLDCADLKRTGGVYRINKNNKPVLNIDHHISNRGFGDAHWVDPQASSCSEMIYRIYKQMRIPISRPEAICLYTGMMTDTGSFRYSNTSSFTHQAVAELLKFNINVPLIYRYVYENLAMDETKLLIKLLPQISFSVGGRIAYFKLKRNLLKNGAISMDLGDQLLSFGRSIKGVEVVLLFKESPGVKNQVRINLRSHGKVDVNKIAAIFGGGGHKTAAGCTAHGETNQVVKQVLASIQRVLK
ncbi:MAG: bifunctional oligoribonuclease/PAP phosphatase NrnA [Candidatus Omnitrophica bacterium]|nr:bifunctional oligoribonuclease/PAP phosphatase NrnA [Candidatus Omnitrophota bacterium]MDD5252300.1 bifunctional oligoribonuclease/PAP phosphatase NrnA [Candidatus Omnitrophota bacterium]